MWQKASPARKENYRWGWWALPAKKEYLPLYETCFILLCSIFSSLHICTVVFFLNNFFWMNCFAKETMKLKSGMLLLSRGRLQNNPKIHNHNRKQPHRFPSVKGWKLISDIDCRTWLFLYQTTMNFSTFFCSTWLTLSQKLLAITKT